MTIQHAVLAAICVVAMSLSQLLFKRAGMELELTNTWFAVRPLLFTWAAFAISAVAMLMWISLLRHVPLSRAHPFMALSFFIVPISSYLLFHESLSPGYLAGLALVVSGLGVIVCYG